MSVVGAVGDFDERLFVV